MVMVIVMVIVVLVVIGHLDPLIEVTPSVCT